MRLRGQQHLTSHKIVGQQLTPEFLNNSRGCLASQTLLALEHVSLQFVESDFDLPSFMVQLDQFFRGIFVGIQQGYKESAWLAALVLVLNHANHDGFGRLWMFAAEPRRSMKPRQCGPVRQNIDDLVGQTLLGPHHDVSVLGLTRELM